MNPQEYQIQQFLERIDEDFHYYGNVDANLLYDYASSFRRDFADILEDELDSIEDESFALKLNDYIDYLNEHNADEEYRNCANLLKEIFNEIFSTKAYLKKLDLDGYLERSFSDDFWWVIDWISIYLKNIEKIKSDIDLAYCFLGCSSIDLNIFNYFDKSTIKKLAKTSEGKRFLDNNFPYDKNAIDEKLDKNLSVSNSSNKNSFANDDLDEIIGDFEEYTFEVILYEYVYQDESINDENDVKNLIKDLTSTKEKQLKLWAEFSKNSNAKKQYPETTKQVEHLLKSDKNLLLKLMPVVLDDLISMADNEAY